MENVDLKKPVIIGGLIAALSWFIPFLSVLNCLACFWAWVGAILAVYMVIPKSSEPLMSSDGARIGGYCGLLGAAIFFVISVPFEAWQLQYSLQEMLKLQPISQNAQMVELIEKLQGNKTLQILLAIITGLICSMFMIGFSIIAGMLGVKMFEKRTLNPSSPPMPPEY